MSRSIPTPAEIAALPKAEFAFPGPLRDQLVAAILGGAKTSTTGLVVDYEHEGEALPEVGERVDDPEFTVDDATLAVLQRFRLVVDLR